MAQDEELLSSAPIGPGTIEVAGGEYIPALDSATRDDIVEILNPMSRDFVARVGVSRTAAMPVRIVKSAANPNFNESDLNRAGVSGFRNPDLGGGRVHVSNTVTIPAGRTIKQPGDVAQVIVKQLITTIIQVRGEKLMIADPATRQQVEREVIIDRRPMADLFGADAPVSIDEQINQRVAELNRTDEDNAFPDAQTEVENAQGPKAKAGSK